MPEIYLDVDVALAEVPVNVLALTDDTDFKTRETGVTYDQAGMDLVWNFTTTAGATSQTAVTPTAAGDYDWTHQGDGMYTIEIPASGGASMNNDTEGFGWFTGYATGVLPWRGPIIGFRAAGINNLLIDSAYSATRGLTGTALPDAVSDAAGGLTVSDAGGFDADELYDAIVTDATGANIAVDIIALKAETVLIVEDTGELQTNQGGWATATGFATPTNITAGTITTVTNLTNAATAGDLTATMKTSVNTEVDTGLITYNLDHLALTATAGADMTAEVADNTILSRLLANGNTSDFVPSTGGLQPIRARGDAAWTTGAGGSDRLLMVDTTIATLASQTSFTLTAGSTDDNAYVNATVVIEDVATATQKALGLCSAYTGGTKTVTLKYDPAVFTMAVTDKVYILAENALKSTAANRQLDVSTTGEAGLDFDNIKNATGAHTLTNITVPAVTTTVDLTNAATAGDLTATMKTSVNTEVDNSMVTYNLDHLALTATGAADMTTEVADNTILSRLLANGNTSDFIPSTGGLQPIRTRGDAEWTTGAGGSDRLLMVDTTIATLASQTSFTLTAGSTDDNAYRNATVVIEDVATATQKALGLCSAYVGGTKTVTLKYDPAVFTMAVTDKVYILAENALKSSVANRQLDVSTTGEAGLDFDTVKNATGAHTLTNITVPTVTTVTTNTDMRGTDGANTTSPPTVGEVRTEMEGAGTKLTLTLEDTGDLQTNQGGWATATGFATPTNITAGIITTVTTNTDMRGTNDAALAATALADATWTDARAGYLDELAAANLPSDIEDLKTLAGSSGDIFYVSAAGDDSDGTTWATAKNTIDDGVGLLTANHGDRLYIAPGTYDETANGANGVLCDVEGVWIMGILPGVSVTNTDVTDNGSVFYATAHNTLISNVSVSKGETTSNGAVGIKVNGSGITTDLRSVTVEIGKTTHTGIKFMGGATSCSYMDDDLHLSHIYSSAGVGVGIEFADCIGCVVVDPQIHDLDYGMTFTGGASCHHNTISPQTAVVSCDTGVLLNAGAYSNMLSNLVLNCTTAYADNSGVDTNKTEGSLTYVLSDILASIVASNPQTHYATASSAVTYGTVDSGAYGDTDTDNDVYWQISPVAVNALDMYSQFLIGAGRTPSVVEFNGRFDAHPSRYGEVYAWNYSTSTWDRVSSDSNRITHSISDYDLQFSLTLEHVQNSDGEMRIRVYSTSVTTGDDLYIDKMIVTSVAQSAGGLTADAVASATWNRSVETFVGARTAGSRLRRLVAVGTEVATADTATSFTLAEGKTNDDAYNGMLVRVGCTADEDSCETRRILNWTAGRIITLDRALSFTPGVGDLVRILNSYGNVDLGSIAGSTPLVDKFAASVGTMVLGVATAGTLSTTQMTTNLGGTGLDDENFVGRYIILISGINTARQVTEIESYTDATGLFTFTEITTAPIADDTFIII